MPISLSLKGKLHDHCLSYIEERVERAKTEMEFAQASANEESKSSAGDKFETGRAMMQIQRDKSALQLSEALKLQNLTKMIKPTKKHESVQLGSLVETDFDIFYFSISIGAISIGNKTVMCLSPGSPLGQCFLKKVEGELAKFRGRDYMISKIV